MDIWTKETYLAALERELRPMDPQERLEALEYYREYLEEAGPERERQVIEGLGSPKELAAQLMAQSPVSHPSAGWKWLLKIGLGLAALIALPLVPCLAACVLVTALSLVLALAGLLLGLYATAFSLGIAGLACLLAGLFAAPQTPFAGLTLLGSGIALGGLGGLLFIPTHSLTCWLLGKWSSWLRRIRARRRGRQDARRDIGQEPAAPQEAGPTAYEILSGELTAEEGPQHTETEVG